MILLTITFALSCRWMQFIINIHKRKVNKVNKSKPWDVLFECLHLSSLPTVDTAQTFAPTCAYAKLVQTVVRWISCCKRTRNLANNTRYIKLHRHAGSQREKTPSFSLNCLLLMKAHYISGYVLRGSLPHFILFPPTHSTIWSWHNSRLDVSSLIMGFPLRNIYPHVSRRHDTPCSMIEQYRILDCDSVSRQWQICIK